METPDLMTRVSRLKDQVMHGKDFFKTFDAFLRLTENDELPSNVVKDPAQSEMLKKILELTCVNFFKKKQLVMSHMMILEVPGTTLHHGGFATEGGMCSFIFFPDVGMGLLAFARLGNPNTNITRITCQVVGGPQLFN